MRPPQEFNNFAIQRLEEIQKELDAPRPSATMDCRHDDWGDGNGSYWGRLKEEKARLMQMLGMDKPDKWMSSEEKFAKYGKSPMMLAQEAAARAITGEMDVT